MLLSKLPDEAITATNRTPLVGRRMQEEPIIYALEVKIVRQDAVILTWQQTIDESSGITHSTHTINDTLRGFPRHRMVGCTMQDAKRHLQKILMVRLGGITTAQSQSSSYAVGRSSSIVDGSITSHTHTKHIDTCRVDGIAFQCPIDQTIDTVGLPSTCRMLRSKNVGIEIQPFRQGIEGTIAADHRQVATSEAGTMQEDYQGFANHGFHQITFLALDAIDNDGWHHSTIGRCNDRRNVEPEVIGIFHCPAMRYHALCRQ